MGKVLIEKLLRSCPDLNQIFLLIRGKKNKTPEQRLEELGKIPVFDRLHQEYPNHFSKLRAINGDSTMIGLGISEEDLKRMENVSVIFHSAASVRFDDSLKNAVLLNTRGTVEVMRFAESLKQIRVVVHVSTTYCNPNKRVVEEMIYPPNGDWREAIKIAEKYDDDILNALTQKYTNAQPNTYTFTKGLAEQVVKEYSDRLPVVIYRPSIVVSSLDEPMPGWIDNFNGISIFGSVESTVSVEKITNDSDSTASLNSKCYRSDGIINSLWFGFTPHHIWRSRRGVGLYTRGHFNQSHDCGRLEASRWTKYYRNSGL